MLKKLAISGLIWLTAVSTLMAGSPHLTCRCPDGSIKLFCFSLFTSITQNESGHQSCCGAKSHKPSCCQEKVATRAQEKTDGPAFTTPGCQKSIVQAEAAVVENVCPVLDIGLNITQDSYAIVPTGQGFPSLDWSYKPESPPIDLLLVLQHFLI